MSHGNVDDDAGHLALVVPNVGRRSARCLVDLLVASRVKGERRGTSGVGGSLQLVLVGRRARRVRRHLSYFSFFALLPAPPRRTTQQVALSPPVTLAPRRIGANTKTPRAQRHRRLSSPYRSWKVEMPLPLRSWVPRVNP